jgi:hypothetical protein
MSVGVAHTFGLYMYVTAGWGYLPEPDPEVFFTGIVVDRGVHEMVLTPLTSTGRFCGSARPNPAQNIPAILVAGNFDCVAYHFLYLGTRAVFVLRDVFSPIQDAVDAFDGFSKMLGE